MSKILNNINKSFTYIRFTGIINSYFIMQFRYKYLLKKETNRKQAQLHL